MNTVIYGACGKMGSLLLDHLLSDDRFDLMCGIDPLVCSFTTIPIYTSLSDIDAPELIIDFSHPSNIDEILEYAVMNKIALVIATTGHSQLQKQLIIDSSKQIPIFYSSNLSFGIHIINKILKSITKELEDEFDIEIIEKHHRLKFDSPSGTAKLLASTIQSSSKKDYKLINGRSIDSGKRTNTEIGVHAIRCGGIVGDHTVIFASNDEVIEITHQALSKTVFVHGAIKAALFICNQAPGLYI